MGRFLVLTVAMAIFAVMTMDTGLMAQAPGNQQTKPKSTWVAKPTESPERTACLGKCRATADKAKRDCDRISDPVERAYCMQRLNGPYNHCAGKCPKK